MARTARDLPVPAVERHFELRMRARCERARRPSRYRVTGRAVGRIRARATLSRMRVGMTIATARRRHPKLHRGDAVRGAARVAGIAPNLAMFPLQRKRCLRVLRDGECCGSKRCLAVACGAIHPRRA